MNCPRSLFGGVHVGIFLCISNILQSLFFCCAGYSRSIYFSSLLLSFLSFSFFGGLMFPEFLGCNCLSLESLCLFCADSSFWSLSNATFKTSSWSALFVVICPVGLSWLWFWQHDVDLPFVVVILPAGLYRFATLSALSRSYFLW